MPTVVPELAMLGHQDSWEHMANLVEGLRPPERGPLTPQLLRELVPWIPPRVASRVRFGTEAAGEVVNAIYVETFITPDDLAAGAPRGLLTKVRDGVRAAAREGARLATLGGFTSIVGEGRVPDVPDDIALTTGNTLTAALIVRGVRAAAELVGIDLDAATVAIVGASGDVGSACARGLGPHAGRLRLVARNRRRVADDAARLRRDGIEAAAAGQAGDADIVVTAASTPARTIALDGVPPHALICDAGYPANVARIAPGARRFRGGLGRLRDGYRSNDGMIERFYRFPAPDVVHGCLLEGVVLARAGRYESFSRGRGKITPERMEEIWQLALRHGVEPAPLFDAELWPRQPAGPVPA